MGIKPFLPIGLVCGLAITACGGGSSSEPAAANSYGQVVAISQQQLAEVQPGSSYADIAVLSGIMASTGNYPTTANSLPYQTANYINTLQSYHYDVAHPINAGVSDVAAYVVTYKTPGQNSTTQPAQISRTVSGLIIVPQLSAGAKLKGVVIYYHPTTLGKNQVPSCLGAPSSNYPQMSLNLPGYCKLSQLDNTGAGIFSTLSALYAQAGYAVVAPDYVGQGIDYNEVHPYVVYPENNALSGFNLLPALRQILASSSLNISSATPLNLFITGYSEGGGYALKASQLAQSTQANFLEPLNLNLVITSPQEGAYSLSDQMNFAFDNNNDGVFNCQSQPSFNCGNVDAMTSAMSTSLNPQVLAMNNWNVGSAAYAAGYKPVLTSYVLTAATYYNLQNLSGAYDQSMNHQFWAEIPLTKNLLANLYQLYSGIYGPYYTGSQISQAILANTFTINNYDSYESLNSTLFTPTGSLAQQLLVGRYGNNNSATNFINPKISTDPVFEQILATASSYNWQTHSPINFIHLVYDSAVTVINTHQAYSCMKYGVSYPGTGNLVASQAPCNTAASGTWIESTIIHNFQLTNNTNQLSPLSAPNVVNSTANSLFWTASPQAQFPQLGTPFDHADMFVLGNIVALCTFENSANGLNSGVCQ